MSRKWIGIGAALVIAAAVLVWWASDDAPVPAVVDAPTPARVLPVPAAPAIAPTPPAPPEAPVAAAATPPDAGLPQREPQPDDIQIHGEVVDGRGAPIAGAAVTLERFENATRTPQRSELVTDAHGRFEHVAASARFVVEVEAPKWLIVKKEKLVEPGQSWNVKLVLDPASLIRGTVTGADGQPISEASIVSRSREPDLIFTRARSDKRGAFELGNRPGRVELDVTASGFIAAQSILTAPKNDVRIVLQKGGAVSGSVVDEQGAAVKDVLVTTRNLKTFNRQTSRSGADGRFRIEGLEDGRFEVTASDAGRSAKAAIDLKGATTPFLELRLKKSEAVRGKVVDEKNRPLAGIIVTAVRGTGVNAMTLAIPFPLAQKLASTRVIRDVILESSPHATSAVDGTFVFDGLEGDEFRLVATGKGLRSDPETRLVVRPGMSDIVLMLLRPHYLRANVKDPDGKPLAQVMVGEISYATPAGQLAIELTFSFAGQVRFSAEGYGPQLKELKLTVNDDVDLGELRFDRGRSLVIDVVGVDRTAIVKPAFKLDMQTLTASPSGTGWKVSVPDGELRLYVGAERHVEKSVRIAPDQTSLSVTLSQGSTVNGTARSPSGQLLPEGEYRVSVSDCGFGRAEVGPQGNFTVTGIESGSCSANLTRTSDRAQGPVLSFQAPENGTVAIDLVGP